MSDITVLSVDIGHFSYGRKIIHVFENSRNQAQFIDKPDKWQFVIEPILSINLTEMKPDTIDLDSLEKLDHRKSVSFRRHRLRLPVQLINNDAINKALEVIYTRYPEAKCKTGPQNVDVLPITSMQLSFNDVDLAGSPFHNSVQFRSANLNYLTSPSVIYAFFDITERSPRADTSEVSRFIAFLPFMSMEATLSFSVKSTLFNISSVVSEKLKDTNLFAKLNGDGSETYVSRDDLRTLTQSAATQLRAIQIVEDRESFDDALFRSIIAGSTTISADEAFFNSEQGKHTYDADDLKPSVITEKLNKAFDYDSGKDQWSLSTKGSAGGSFLDIVKADFSGSLSTSQMHEFLKKHSLETDIKSNLIVVKTVNLQQINISHLIQNSNFGTEYRNIEKGSPKQGLKTAIYGEDARASGVKTFPDLTKGCDAAKTLMLGVY